MNESIIGAKSKSFAVRIIRFYKYLCNTRNEYILAKQILRCGTSIGANAREAKNAQSKADFINKLNIALKEADETAYWLEILYESEIITQDEYDSMYDDCTELIKILTSIIKSSK